MQFAKIISFLCSVVCIITATVTPIASVSSEVFAVGLDVSTTTPISADPLINR